jgi:hypothetical protein
VRFDGSRDRDALFHFVSHTAAVTFTYKVEYSATSATSTAYCLVYTVLTTAAVSSTFKGEGHGAGVADQQQDDTM